MTVSSETSRVVHVGDGDTGPFAISFYFLENADIRAIKVTIADGTEDELLLDTDFTLEGAGEEDGGTLTLTEALSSDYRIVIFRDPSVTQETAYPPNDPFPSESHEQVADRLTMIAQRQAELVDRSIRQPDGDTADIEALPAKETRASKYLAFDADGNPVATSGTSESAVISTFSETLLDDESAGSWLTTLGFSAYIKTLVAAASAAAFRALFTPLTTKGDLWGYGSIDQRVGVGADGTVLVADSSATPGVSWQATGFTTGDVKLTLKTTADTGWVLMNDGTIGNASSGGTTRANADTEDLFTLLWNNTADGQCPVSGGRGANAAADFAANKTITLPLVLGRALAVYGSGAGLTARALAETVGAETHQLTEAELAAHTHGDGTYAAASDGAHAHTVDVFNTGAGSQNSLTVASVDPAANTVTATSQIVNSAADHTHDVTGTSGSTGSDTAHPNMQPTLFLNVMVKL